MAQWSACAWETAAIYGPEYKQPKSDVPKALFICGAICLVTFILVQAACTGALGIEGILAEPVSPMLPIAQMTLGPIGGSLTIFMVSNTGVLLSYPTHKEWIGKKNLYDFKSKEIARAADDIKNGTGGYIEVSDSTTGKPVVMFYEPVRTGDLAFVLVIPKEEMLAGVVDLRNRLLVISAISILFMKAKISGVRLEKLSPDVNNFQHFQGKLHEVDIIEAFGISITEEFSEIRYKVKWFSNYIWGLCTL